MPGKKEHVCGCVCVYICVCVCVLEKKEHEWREIKKGKMIWKKKRGSLTGRREKAAER